MMKIDVVVKGDGLLFRFESDFIPKKGETISDPKAGDSYEVLEVDHLLHTGFDISKRVCLVTLTVFEIG